MTEWVRQLLASMTDMEASVREDDEGNIIVRFDYNYSILPKNQTVLSFKKNLERLIDKETDDRSRVARGW